MSADDERDPTPTAGTTVPDPATVDDPAELRAQIAETRGELGDTVEALSHELDVKAKVKESVDERKQAVADGVQHAKESVEATAASAKAKLADVAGAAQERAGSVASDAAGQAGAARERAAGAAHGATERAPDASRDPRTVALVLAGAVVLVVLWRRRSS